MQICSIFSKTRLYHNYGSGNLLQIFGDNFWSYNFLLEVVPSVNLSQKLWHHTRTTKICWFQFISWFNFNSNRAGKFLPPPTSKVIIKKKLKKKKQPKRISVSIKKLILCLQDIAHNICINIIKNSGLWQKNERLKKERYGTKYLGNNAENFL